MRLPSADFRRKLPAFPGFMSGSPSYLTFGVLAISISLEAQVLQQIDLRFEDPRGSTILRSFHRLA